MVAQRSLVRTLGTMRTSSPATPIVGVWHGHCSLLTALKPRLGILSQDPGREVLDDIISPAQVAALLRLNVKTIYKLAERGAIPGRRFGRSWRFSKKEILALLAATPTRRVQEKS
jgi:excisionase family DNA binding protein